MSTHKNDGGDSSKWSQLSVFKLYHWQQELIVFIAIDWTTQNVQRLLAELKRSVPEKYKTCSYIGGMKSIQWENVAFPPFSAEACQAKWLEILWKVGNSLHIQKLQ